MTKSKGRPKKRRLADMSASPPPDRPDRYERPPLEDCEEYKQTFDLAVGHKMGLRQRFLRGRNELVDFAVWQKTFDGGAWHDVVRIDCAHGEVHVHRYTRAGEEHRQVLEVIPPDGGPPVIDRWFTRAEGMMQNGWYENVGRWNGDPQ